MTQLQNSLFRLKTAPTEKKQTFLAITAAVSIFLPFYLTSCVIVAIALYVLGGKYRRSRVLAMPYSKLIFGVIGTGVIISLGYENSYGAMIGCLMICGLILAFYLRSFMTRGLFQKMMDVVCAGGLCVSIIGIVQKLFGTAGTRPAVVFDNPNFFATVMEMVVLIAVYRLLGNGKYSNFYFITALFCAFGVYISGSLSALAVCTAGVVLYLVLRGHNKVAVMIALSVTAFVLLATQVLPEMTTVINAAQSRPGLSETVKNTASQMLTIRTEEQVGNSVFSRFSIWKTSLQAIPDHLLFGQGPNTYAMVYSRYLGFASSHAHNMLLDVVLNYGIIGGGAIVFFVFQQFHVAARKVRERKSTTTNLLLIVIAVMMAMHGMTDVTLIWPQTGLLFLLVYCSSGIRTVPQARCFVLRAPDFTPNPQFKRNPM